MNSSTFTTGRRFVRCLVLLTTLSLLTVAGLRAQNVNVTGALVGNGTYATLGAAFTAINGGAQGGANIVVTIVNNTSEGTATATLNQSSTPWATLSIQPSGGAWTISGATTAGSPMIDFNGADNVTVDGLNTSGNALTIANTTVSATSGTSTIRFQTDASNNTITRCSVQGSSTMAAGTNGGTIWIGAAAVTTGNDNNTISFCNIGPAGSNLPTKAIYGNGSTSTTAVFNSGVQLLNNNIFDYFNVSAQSNGIYVSGGNTDWTISTNRLYQTATRTQTTAAIHAGIQLASANINNTTVSGNVIGFASSAGTGTYTLVGISGTRFYPLYVTAHGTTTASNFTGNTVTSINLSGAVNGTLASSPFAGLLISSTGLVNFNGNTIGSQLTSGAITISANTGSASDIYGMFNNSSSSMLCNTNIVGGITMSNAGSAAINFHGLRINTASTATSQVQGNQIGGAVANSIQVSGTSTSSSVHGISLGLSTTTVTGNTIASLTVNAGNGTTTPSVAGIMFTSTSSNYVVTGNNIGALSNLNPTSTGHVSGIAFTASTGPNLIEKNLIHSLVVISAAATLNGIQVLGGTATYQNNMIRLGVDPLGTALTVGCAINGINETSGVDNFYHNSVYIGGTGVGGASNTFALQSTVTSSTRNYLNNIFYNARSNGAGTGKHYGLRFGGITVNPAGLTSNNNDVLANGTGGLVGLYNGVDYATLPAWRTATGQDNASFGVDPNFVAPNGTAISLDLHIANPTPIEGNGILVAAVTDDYDGQTRSGLSPVDVGADAGNFTGTGDFVPPSIIYTTLTNSCISGDRVITATIADVSGVPVTGGLQPRIYFRKNAGGYVSTQGVLTSGTGTSGTWDFTISAAALGGLTGGDVVSYYVIAQDLGGPNIISNPAAGLVATDVNTVTTPPTTPNAYNVFFTLSGTYTVGATGNFTTLTAAVNAYNTACLTGPVLFNLIDAAYAGETFPISVNLNAQASSVNTLTIKPTLAGTLMSGSSTTALIKLNGANFVTIDGSIGSTVNSFCPPVTSASRDLSFTNTSTASATAVIWLSSAGAGLGATNCTVKNCNIANGVDQSTTATENYGIVSCGTTITTFPPSDGLGNNSILLENNAVTKTTWGIYLRGGGSSSNTGNIVRQNLIGPAAFGANEIRKGGIVVQNQDGVNVTGNEVRFVGNLVAQTVGGTDHIGIGIGGADGPTPTTSNVTNAVVTHNNIHDIVDEKTFSSIGLVLAASNATASNNLIANNMVSNVRANGTLGDQGIGIDVANGNGDRIVYNSVNMVSADRDPGASSTSNESDIAFRFQAGELNPLFKDNIFYIDEASNTATLKNFAVVAPASTYTWGTGSSNYNDYAINAGNAQNVRFGLGTTGAITQVTTLAAWQATFTPTQDANSISVVPTFTSATDLHLVANSSAGLDNLGNPVAGVTTDIDCATRNATTPDMGVDEFTSPAPVITYTPLVQDCNTGNKVFTATITDVEGVPTTGALQPRVYYKKNAGGYFSSQGVLSSGTGTNGTWTFTIVAADMGGLVGGDVISYYVIAQDIVAIPNIGANPSGGLVATDVNTVTTHPTSPNTVGVGISLGGVYTIGVAGNFATLTAAVNTYNGACITGPIVFNLIDANYPSETFPITINANAGQSATNTLTIKATTTSTITGSSATSIFLLNGADYVTIDGSSSSTVNTVCPVSAASRNLTITNTNTSTASAVVWLGTTGANNAVTNCTVRNCIISGASAATTLIGLGVGGAAIGNAGTSNDNISLINNDIRACQFGIYSAGASGVLKNQNLTVNQNVMTTLTPNHILQTAIYVAFTNNVTISGNNINNLTSAGLQDVVGINVGFGAVNGLATTATGIADGASNVTITNNIIGSVQHTATFSAAGICLGNVIAGTNLIANNMISGVGSNGTLGDFCAGIILGGGSTPVNVYHNTVSMQGTMPGASSGTQVVACLAVTSAAAPTGLAIRNNIFSNTQLGNASSTARFVAVGYQFGAPFTSIVSNNNDLVSAGAGPGTYFVGTTAGLVGGTTAATLANWQTATGGDANSLTFAPVFTSATDLHLVSASNIQLNDVGTPLASVTNDIDCATRSATTPDLGADEFTPPACAGTPTAGTATASVGTVCSNLPVTLSLTGFSAVSGLTFQWQSSLTPGGPYTSIPGATTTSYTGVVPVAGTYYITCLVTCTNGGATALSNELTLTVRPTPAVTVSPTSGVICNPAGTPVTLTASSTGGTGAVTFTWSPTSGLTPTTGSPVSANPTVSTTYVVTGTDATGCLSTATAAITVGSVVTGLTATATPSTLCAGGNSQLLATGSFASTANQYSFAAATGATLDPMTGSTTILGTSIDDDPNLTPIAIGFPFVFEGITYTQYSVTPDGWVRLGSTAAAAEFTNAVTSNANVPRLYPFWDDLATGTDGSVKTLVTGTSPNRIFKVQWFVTVPRNVSGSANSTFQAWLYENGGRIEYRYGTMGLPTSGSISGGITGLTSTNFHSLSYATNTSSNTVANDVNTTAPALGTMYTYTPPALSWAWSPSTFIAGQTTLANPLATAMTATTTYTVVATTPAGCSATTTVAVTVNPVLVPSVTITAAPGTTICAGTSVTFTATPTNGGTTPAYQWKKNNINVGINSSTYTDAALANGDVVTCVLTSNATCASPTTATSNALTMTVNALVTPSVTIAAAPGTTICAGTSVTFTATPVNGGAAPSYVWTKNSIPVGTNSPTYTDGALANGDVILCVLTSNAPCASPTTATSNTINMVVNAVVTPSVSISAAPGNTICAGTNVTFTATPTNGGASPAYQWLKNSSPVGTNSATYSDNALNSGDVITCVLTSNATCASPATVTSNAITMTVNPLLTPSVTITASPGTTICAGTSVTFTATPVNGGTSPAYQWRINGSPVGTNSPTFTSAALLNGDLVTVDLTSNAVCATPTLVSSNTLTITVNPLLTPSVSITASPGTTICAGTNVTFTATVTNGGTTPVYQWRVNGSPVGTNSPTYSSTTLANGEVVTVDLTSNATCASPAMVTSNAITMTVNAVLAPSVSIAAFPGTSICAGTNVTFTATPVNGGVSPSYQWFLNSSPVGTNSATYSNNALANGDVVTCTLTSSNVCASPTTATSNALTIAVVTTVTPTVSISVSPGTTICPGATATFTAAAVNSGTTPSYQWFLNGSPVGTNSPTYTNSTLVSGNFVHCVVTSSDPCALPTTATSNTITMTVGDFTPPTAVCQNLTLSLNATGNTSTTAAAVNNGSSDNCTAPGALSLSLSTTAFTCANLGANTVSLSVTDAASNIGNCNATITVVDAILPVITCPANISVSAGVGVCSAVATYSAPVGTDNCTPTTTRTTGLASGATYPLGATTNTFQVSDGSGNTATCSFTVTVTDGQLPTITCPANQSLNTSVGLCSATATYTAPVGADNCSGATTTQTAGLASGATYPTGVTTNTFRVTDGAGNTTTCSFTITVIDNQAPTITCGSNVVVNATSGTCGAVVTYATPVGADNCPGTTVNLTTGLPSGSTFPVGVTVNTYSVTDGSGNTTTCSFTVTVNDAQLPTLTCPATQTLSASVGVCSATATYTAPVGADNCAGVTTTQTTGLASGASFPVGTTVNTFRATDASGNTTTCSFNVVVTDGQLPTITCPANISVTASVGVCSAVVSYSAPVGTDNCSGATTTQTAGLASGASFPLGVTTNTFRATDASSNTATCSFTVTVTDNQLPTITCPPSQVVNTSPGACSAVVTYTTPVGTDNCSATTLPIVGLPSGSTFPIGSTLNTYRVTDGSGNSATCSFTITVNDNELPTITCPANISVSASVGSCSAVVTYTTPVGADNCTGVTTAQTAGLASGASFPIGSTTNTFRATDGVGNTATCSFTVAVTDNIVPTITCPANMSVNASAGCDAIVSYSAPVGADNCTGAITTQTAGLGTGATYPLGATTNTFNVTDASSNSATCSFTVTVVDATAPVAACQGVTVTLDANGNGSTTAALVDNGSSDNCTVASTSLSQAAFTCSNAGANTVTLTVTDGSGNTSTCTAVVTVVAPAITGTVTADTMTCGYNVSCSGGNDGVAHVTAGGGCPSYTYVWSNGDLTATATGLGAGTHTVTITDGVGGTFVVSVTLTAPSAITVTSNVSLTCVGDSTGAINITPAGGNDCAAYTFVWSNGDVTEDVSGLTAGSYTVTVTDANGCSTTHTATVGTFAAPAPTFTQVGNLLTSGQVWATYQWLLNGSPISGATSSTFTLSVDGNYSLQVTDANGCSGTSAPSTIVSVEDPLSDMLDLSIYPNPARGEFKLRTANPIAYGLTVTITDMFGKRLASQAMLDLGHEAAFNISGYTAGTYMVEVVTEYGQRKVFKLVIQ